MTEGFVAETKKFPGIAKREFTALEKSLARNTLDNADVVADSWDRNVTQPLAELHKQHEKEWMPSAPDVPKAPEPPAAPDAPAAGPDIIEGDGEGGTTSAAGAKFAGIAQRGSGEAFKQIVSAMQGESPGQKLDKERNKDLKEIKENTRPDKSGGTTIQVAGPV